MTKQDLIKSIQNMKFEPPSNAVERSANLIFEYILYMLENIEGSEDET